MQDVIYGVSLYPFHQGNLPGYAVHAHWYLTAFRPADYKKRLAPPVLEYDI